MREFTLVQDMTGSVDEHWRVFFDPAFEKAIVVALKFRAYDILVHEDTATSIVRKTRAVPKLDAAASVAKLFGASFGYVEEGTFDKATRVWRARTIPDAFSQRMTCDMVMRVEPAPSGTVGSAAPGPDEIGTVVLDGADRSKTRSRRTLEFRLEAKVRGVGGMVESSFEKNLRSGWRESAAFLNGWMTEHR